MSTKGAKGKGKSRGGGSMSASMRRSRSRNTTPASGSAFSADTLLSHDGTFNGNISYTDLIANHGISDSSSIPTSNALSALRNDLHLLQENAKARSIACDKQLRELQIKMDTRRMESAQQEADQEKNRRAVEDAERKEKIIKRKKKSDGDNKRPPVIGAHQATGQGPNNDTVAQRMYPTIISITRCRSNSYTGEKKKAKLESPDVKRNESSSPASDLEQQPPPAPPYVVFEPLGDDPAIYEIPAVTADTPYEEKARAFAVSRFPEDDLGKLIPGDPPDDDLSKAKPTNQVAINTFSTYIEPYFRPFSEEDLAFLRERGERDTPYLIPALGRHYSETWAEEDGGTTSFASSAPQTNYHTNKFVNVPRGGPSDISEETADKEEISCGPLLARLTQAFMPVDDAGDEDTEMADPNTPCPPRTYATTVPGAEELNWKIPTQKADYAALEERAEQEFVYCGLLSPSRTPGFNESEDDEVSARLRFLQSKLREQTIINGARKARIAEHLKEQMAYQEYQTILDDLDKQLEQAYSKRSRNMKATKKKKNAPSGAGVAQARMGIGEQAKAIMERRKRWIDTIGPVFEKDLAVLPDGSIFENMEDLQEAERLQRAADDE